MMKNILIIIITFYFNVSCIFVSTNDDLTTLKEKAADGDAKAQLELGILDVREHRTYEETVRPAGCADLTVVSQSCDPRTQALVKTAEGREMVWMKADLMQDSHCRGTGSAIFLSMNIS